MDCNLEKSDWVELKQEGTVHTFTIAGWSAKSFLKKLPLMLAYVVVDGCSTTIANELRGLDPWDAEFNMSADVVWKSAKERQGTVTDWWFEPVDGCAPGPMNPGKERMKELCAPVYKWVKSMKCPLS